MINNCCINEKFVRYIETGERSSAPSRLHWLPSQLPVKPTQSTQVAKKDARGSALSSGGMAVATMTQVANKDARGSALSCGGSGGMAVAATTTTTITPTPTRAVAAAQDNRDPFLVSFEKYLLGNLTRNDVCEDHDTGVYLFNVNRVAYLVEKSQTKDQQRVTRNRLSNALPSINPTLRRLPPSNNGKFLCCMWFLGAWFLIRGRSELSPGLRF